MSSASESQTASFLKDHPRLMGALFMTLLLLSHGVGAAAGGVNSGP